MLGKTITRWLTEKEWVKEAIESWQDLANVLPSKYKDIKKSIKGHAKSKSTSASPVIALTAIFRDGEPSYSTLPDTPRSSSRYSCQSTCSSDMLDFDTATTHSRGRGRVRHAAEPGAAARRSVSRTVRKGGRADSKSPTNADDILGSKAGRRVRQQTERRRLRRLLNAANREA